MDKKALVIDTDDNLVVLDLPEDVHDELRVLRGAVGGDIEYVPLPEGLVMYCNEHGKLERLPANVRATALSGLYPRDIIVGNVVIVGPVGSEGETTGLTSEQIAQLTT